MRPLQHSLLSIFISAAALSATSGNIYVSPAGDDRADGSLNAPIKTPAEALRRAREWRRLKSPEAADTIQIILADGNYTLSESLFIRPEDSGTSSSPTIFRSANDSKAVISGGTEIKGWEIVRNDPRIPNALIGKIWMADAPTKGHRIVETRQLYVDGKKAQRSSQFAPGVMDRMIDFNTSDRTITVPNTDFDIAEANSLEMVVHQRWAIAILRVKDMRHDSKGNLVVSFHDPESRLEFEHPWPQPVIGGEKGNSSYYFTNALQLLDTPGEWYQDYPSGKIYYYPEDGSDPNKSKIIAPALETLVRIVGNPERKVCNVKFENISFEYASWLRPSMEGHVTLQGGFRLIDAYKLAVPGLPEKAELENQAWIARPEAAITVSNSSGIDFHNCLFAHIAATGLDYVAGDSDCNVTECTFTDIGGTAIQIGTFPDGGFETHIPYLPDNDRDICHDILVKSNTITNATNEDWGCVGIGAGYVHDITIADNEVAHINYSGICIGWGWTPLVSSMRNNRITGNHVHHFGGQLYDTGGIYTLSNQPGSIIRDNRIEHLIKAPYATNDRGFYIYFDEATDGFTVENNYCPDAEFGYNRPGPAMIIRNNGPHVKLN